MTWVRAYAQLVRFPNVFTAFADICLGGLAAGILTSNATISAWTAFALLLAASGSLYCAGMVWNDYFDLEQDRRERPFRPIPSGRVTRPAAARLGAGLMAAGLLFAWLAGWRQSGWNWTPLVFASLLAVSILFYDGWLKRRWTGPLAMGTCRFLNVLLGLSLVESIGDSGVGLGGWGLHLAAIVGIYIVGVTWFARTEATTSRRSLLLAAASVMAAALALAVPLPMWFPAGTSSPLFPYLLVATGFVVGLPVTNAINHPKASLVQTAVKGAIFGLVAVDATLATVFAGAAGLLILILLVPGLYLGRWLYST